MIVSAIVAGAVVLAPTGAATPMGYTPPAPPPEPPHVHVEPHTHEPEPHTHAPARNHWDTLADCEANGDWSSRAHSLYQGGLQFHPQTWDAYRDPGMPGHAADASREQQIIVGERVQADQGWKAWPACSLKIGLR